ncbi:16S rRNA (cytidine(1402)-2'-O)-methyltransferase [Gloeocapsa sp. PCC 73106]|uniref:16S rRNA (cytidine(1402)-2'-O)-methyltransferase n=1 Tax=Gloeocapsa sp. PCC 73106 TaxID=102232 RepID=UPI0002AC3999|nr:16S rRNA (cytidine(1402)-2'-O)-methyltransferase [Gloeocapsa sp. PCC 73106]ELR98798.1 putative S-adenosylmethionine-dependent methyltransferase, YraL family [Gloeocapsa sp. PCC 73106]
MTLYLVGTPIGNLEDMTFRAVRILQNVDRIASEDTRHTAKLLQHFQITTPQISYHHHNRKSRTPELIALLLQGKSIALVTDAGMPTISDPGVDLVQEAIAHQIPVVPIPGVTAAITALAVSGLNSDRFVFEGFLPTKSKLRRELLQQLQGEVRTLIFYEAPHRLISTLEDFLESFESDRTLVLARELTKLHEELWRGTLQQALDYHQNREPKGEYTIVLAGATQSETSYLNENQLKQELERLTAQGMTLTQASRELTPFTTLSRREIYQLALAKKFFAEGDRK